MQEFNLFSNIETKETYLELWGGSTKHPDVRYRFSDYDNRLTMSDWSIIGDIYQWVLYCASRLVVPVHAIRLTEWINVIARTYFFWE